MLAGKKILIGVTASIAAYKAATLVRLFVKAKAEVKVVMSPYATEFITPLTLATLSNNPVHVDFIQDKSGVWNNHVALGLWADALVIAPASANTLAKCSTGLCDNLLMAVYLSAKCPTFFAPAMDLDMYKHPSTQKNLKTLEHYGNYIIPSEHGELASGLVGQGRMAEPENIWAYIQDFFSSKVLQDFKGKKALVTAGPTQESLDPVRFITNHSSGKMGYAIATSLAKRGAEVVLVSGPTNLPIEQANIQKIAVRSAQEMYEAANTYFEQSDVIVLSAAVADFTPLHKADQKIKKQANEEELVVRLKRTVDIAKTFGQKRNSQQCMVGFALETQNELDNAQRKLQSKNLDLIVLNSLNDPGAGFGHDTNKVKLINRAGEIKAIDLKSKVEIAEDIVNEVSLLMNL